MRAVIISMPKAGTYLAANLLQCLGMNFSHIHIDPGMHRIFHDNNLKKFDKFSGNVGEAVSKLKENQFAVGHIPFNVENQRHLNDFKKVLIIRDKKDIAESAKRYRQEKGPDVSSIINDANLNAIKKWSDNGAFVIDFKDIITGNLEKIDRLQNYLFGSVTKNSNKAIADAKNMDSLTKSSLR